MERAQSQPMQRAARGRAHTRPAPHNVPNRILAVHRRTVKAVSLEKDLLLFCCPFGKLQNAVVQGVKGGISLPKPEKLAKWETHRQSIAISYRAIGKVGLLKAERRPIRRLVLAGWGGVFYILVLCSIAAKNQGIRYPPDIAAGLVRFCRYYRALVATSSRILARNSSRPMTSVLPSLRLRTATWPASCSLSPSTSI